MRADTRFFFIDYDDFRHILKTDNRPTAVRKGDTENIHIQTWGAHSAHVVTTKAGTLDAFGWLAVQTGRWGTQTQRSYALDVETGYQPAILPALKTMAARRLHDGIGRRKSQRQQARNFLSDSADAAPDFRSST